ncbi:hypothetical protein BSG1_00835 [Bacillus sp. SG-1]|nr:hypothetical protein BSG1_00835 [Bacillus sp. SG-1]
MNNRIFLLTILAIISSITLAGCATFEAESDWEVEDFTYTNQNNEEVGLSDLKGSIWVADFIFTNCDTVCPPMTYNLTQFKRNWKKKGEKM